MPASYANKEHEKDYNKALTVINKVVSAGKEVGRTGVLVGVEAEGEGSIEGNAPPGRNRPAVATPKWRVDEFLWIRLLHLRIHLHIFVDTPAHTPQISRAPFFQAYTRAYSQTQDPNKIKSGPSFTLRRWISQVLPSGRLISVFTKSDL